MTRVTHIPGRGRVCTHDQHRRSRWPVLAQPARANVLSGLITGLPSARGLLAPFSGAQYASCCHVEDARRFGPGLIAEDSDREIPHVFAALKL